MAMPNVIARALSERLLSAIEDVIPWLNREGIPLLRDIRTVLNGGLAITSVTGDFTVTDETVIEYTGTGGHTITLPSAAFPPGLRTRKITILNTVNSLTPLYVTCPGQATADELIDGVIFPAVVPRMTRAEFISNGTYQWTSSPGRQTWDSVVRRIIIGSSANWSGSPQDSIAIGTRVNSAHDGSIVLGTDAASDAAHKLRVFLSSAVKMELTGTPASGETGLWLICDNGTSLAVRQVTLAASVGGQRALQVAG